MAEDVKNLKRSRPEKVKQTKISSPFFNFKSEDKHNLNKKARIEEEAVEIENSEKCDIFIPETENIDTSKTFVFEKDQVDKSHEYKSELTPKNYTSGVADYSTFTRHRVDLMWKQIRGENLNVDHAMLFSNNQANTFMSRCEEELEYFQGDLAKVQIFGKWIDIPRKQVAHGDEGLTYSFSGNTIPARPWSPLLREIRDCVAQASGYNYNFVLINRYKDGTDYMGEHKDDEKDLCPSYPIASLTLGQSRDFVFKHQDKKRGTRQVDTVSVQLRHGMLLMMKHPTNTFWYHSLPKRAKAPGVRINMTFRKMDRSKCKPVSFQKR